MTLTYKQIVHYWLVLKNYEYLWVPFTLWSYHSPNIPRSIIINPWKNKAISKILGLLAWENLLWLGKQKKCSLRDSVPICKYVLDLMRNLAYYFTFWIDNDKFGWSVWLRREPSVRLFMWLEWIKWMRLYAC